MRRRKRKCERRRGGVKGEVEMQGDDWKLMNMISELVELTVMV